MKKNIRFAMVMFLSQLLKVDINKQVALEIDYLKAENQSLKFQFKQTGKRLRLTDEQRQNLAIKGKALGERLYDVVTIVRPETLLKWYNKLVAVRLLFQFSTKVFASFLVISLKLLLTIIIFCNIIIPV